MKYEFFIGMFGKFTFTIRKKRKVKGVVKYFVTPFEIEGAEVIEVDPRNVLLRCQAGEEYLVTRHRITLFEEMKKVDV